MTDRGTDLLESHGNGKPQTGNSLDLKQLHELEPVASLAVPHHVSVVRKSAPDQILPHTD